jgi:8-oxo-dGTP pyrophosphatase MutT (NUDIX family)
VLLARHRAHGKWLLPGGSIEPGETPAQAVFREMLEETGLNVWLTKIVGVFGGRDYVVVYPNGDRTSYVSTVFEAFADDYSFKLDDAELSEVRWASRDDYHELDVAPWVAEVLEALFREDNLAWFRPFTE